MSDAIEELKKHLSILVEFGLWEQVSFHSADLYKDFQIYRGDNDLYFSCQVENKIEPWYALLLMFE